MLFKSETKIPSSLKILLALNETLENTPKRAIKTILLNKTPLLKPYYLGLIIVKKFLISFNHNQVIVSTFDFLDF
ncbi:hypothetical protein HpBT273_11560 [Helicobacter pylori]